MQESSLISNTEQDIKRQFIRDHAFVGCKYKEEIAQKRAEALLDFDLESSMSIQVNNISVIWVYKYAIDVLNPIKMRNSKELKFDEIETRSDHSQRPRSVSENENLESQHLTLTQSNLAKIDTHESFYATTVKPDNNSNYIECLLNDNL